MQNRKVTKDVTISCIVNNVFKCSSLNKMHFVCTSIWICYLHLAICFLCIENENTYWLAILRLLIYYFFVLLFCNCLKNFDNSYKVCTQSHSWYAHTVTQLTQSMCEESKSTQWSKNWPYLWLMAYEISSGIFSNMPMYQPLHSAFVVILLATLMMIKKQSKIMPSSSWLSTERINSVTEYTHTHFCWFY